MGIIIQERDRHLFRELAVMRVIDREQAKVAAGFHSTTRANARLLSLTKAGLLRRFFLGTIGGARKALYALSPSGAKLVGATAHGPRRKRDETLVADFFVAHQIRINEVYLILKHRAIPVQDCRFVRWLSFYEALAAGHQLIPDGYAEIAISSRTIPAFLEVDLGHESHAVWRAKVEAYLRYAASGKFTERFGHPQFRTLVITDSERRMQSLRSATAAVTKKLFWFTTFEAISQDGFWSPIWQRAEGSARLPLIEVT